MPDQKKLILVIGATGAQGFAVIDALLASKPNGIPSPYAIRALTRDPAGKRGQQLSAKGVECVKGSFDDFAAVKDAFKGCYGAWVNTDGFTVGEQKEIYCGMRIFEIAKATPTMRHYVWSNLDYSLKKGNYQADYKVEHYDGKGRVAEWLKAQPSIVGDDTLSWSVVTTGPYMDMLSMGILRPLNRREDGTLVFASPIEDGHVPMIVLSDLGYFARYTFDHRKETSAQDLEVASDVVGWDDLVETFTRVTGRKAVFKRLTLDEWWDNFIDVDNPIANERKPGDGSTTVRQNFSAFWRQWRDDIIDRDMDWVRTIHPGVLSLEAWMRQTNYTGEVQGRLLKNVEDGKSFRVNLKQAAKL